MMIMSRAMSLKAGRREHEGIRSLLHNGGLASFKQSLVVPLDAHCSHGDFPHAIRATPPGICMTTDDFAHTLLPTLQNLSLP